MKAITKFVRRHHNPVAMGGMQFSYDISVLQRPNLNYSISKACEILGISRKVLATGLKSGVIRSLSHLDINELASRPVISGVDIKGEELPILRTREAQECDDDDRPFYGFSLGKSVEDTLTGVDRWWPQAGSKVVEASGGLIVASGSVIVALLEVSSVIRDSARGVRYESKIAGLMREHGEDFVIDSGFGASPEWEKLASQIIGKRVLGGEGGSITRS